jgi:hypothetical protein
MQSKVTTKWSDRYCILELKPDKALVTDPMFIHELTEFVRKKYSEQPLSYFNSNHALWIVNIDKNEVRPLSLKIEI